MNNIPHIKILILNWNGIGVIEDCLQSVINLSYDNYSITVIDNGSIDKSIDYIESNYLDVQLIKLDNNLGYAKGYNYAFNQLINEDFEYYLILNNDTIISSDLLNHLYKSSSRYGKNNIYSPKIVYSKEPNIIWYAGAKLLSNLGIVYHIGINQEEHLMKYKTLQTDYISGCCMFIKKDIIDKLGGFNDSYNMYFEDVDLCFRARGEGFKCFVIEDTKIEHKVSHSLGSNKTKKICYKLLSMFKFIYFNNNFIIFILATICHVLLFPIYLLKLVYEEI